MRKIDNGFTLVELLVAIGILFLLIACTVAATSAVQEAGRGKACVSSIHQISHALSMYAQDYDGTYPAIYSTAFRRTKGRPYAHTDTTGQSWWEMLFPYLGDNAPGCPLAARSDWHEPYFMMDYALNTNLSELIPDSTQDAHTFQGQPEYRVNAASKTVTLIEARIGISGLNEPDAKELAKLSVIAPLSLQAEIDRQRFGAIRHQGGGNYAFGDGHVKWFRPEQLRVGKKGDGKSPGFGL